MVSVDCTSKICRGDRETQAQALLGSFKVCDFPLESGQCLSLQASLRIRPDTETHFQAVHYLQDPRAIYRPDKVAGV